LQSSSEEEESPKRSDAKRDLAAGIETEPQEDVAEKDDEANGTLEVFHETQVVGKLMLRIEICDEEEARQAYVLWNASRLHGLHGKRLQKFAQKREDQADGVNKRARPHLLVDEKARIPSSPSSPGTLSSPGTVAGSPEKLGFGERLYNDAFRRHADRRIKNKQHFGDMAAKTLAESVHAVSIKQTWEKDQLENVFERMYNPPPRAFQIKLGPWSQSSERDDEEVSEESAFKWPTEDLDPADAAAGGGTKGQQRTGKNVERRRVAIFKNMNVPENSDSDDSRSSCCLLQASRFGCRASPRAHSIFAAGIPRICANLSWL